MRGDAGRPARGLGVGGPDAQGLGAAERTRGGTLEGHTGWVTACTVTPEGRHVVSASWDQTLKVWELGSGRAVATLEGNTNWVTACAVTLEGRHVVSASNDRTLKVWELGAGARWPRSQATPTG